ncbi:methylated-DNA--[protein]-cysteine S-methyltransferase [Streptomyces galbus]|jgi:methylated-DNA-[protein]-cysteine S-methyltransferase|uniref:Methylated-DNA--[protein]-cysteine S-methyltransferase n=1 Tax=Streptomyces galbus TaxID=33898 RepID=A0ABX1IDA3_STRGB|nr:methylated-DNA--[protein]-cysteine S-methyltransferase [Streptomyces galbus]NKQ23643.1 methylated-DNA--[protein]-cysteine S-methyltransferase [Streptomyces galbus]
MATEATSAPLPVSIVRHRTPVGTLTLAASDEAVLYCAFGDAEEAGRYLGACAGVRVEGPAPARRSLLEQATEELDAYLAGRVRAFDVPVDLRAASPFVRSTVTALDGFVGYGRTQSYGALAARLGRPGAARAVGRALGANPVCVIRPCHRIVAASGRLSGYAGGAQAKRHLLDLETHHLA